MKKEKFLYELVDNYLYTASLGCMVLENYLLQDKTREYIVCANVLDECMNFYDILYEQLDQKIYSEQEVDAILNYLILSLKQKTISNLYNDLSASVKEYLPNSEEFMSKKFLTDVQEISASALKQFMELLRKQEMNIILKK